MSEMILSAMESRVLYLIIEQSGSTTAQLANKIGSPTRDVEEALSSLQAAELIAEQQEGGYEATALGLGRWNEVVYIAAELKLRGC